MGTPIELQRAAVKPEIIVFDSSASTGLGGCGYGCVPDDNVAGVREWVRTGEVSPRRKRLTMTKKCQRRAIFTILISSHLHSWHALYG
jgi:hypothetical protein